MPMTNRERLLYLTQVQEQTGAWQAALDDLLEDAEAAVIRDEEAEDESPFTVVAAGTYDADGDRWESAGILIGNRNPMRYRDTL